MIKTTLLLLILIGTVTAADLSAINCLSLPCAPATPRCSLPIQPQAICLTSPVRQTRRIGIPAGRRMRNRFALCLIEKGHRTSGSATRTVRRFDGLLMSPAVTYMPSWQKSPVGELIVFGMHGDKPEMASIRPDGTSLKMLGDGHDPCYFTRWQTDLLYRPSAGRRCDGLRHGLEW